VLVARKIAAVAHVLSPREGSRGRGPFPPSMLERCNGRGTDEEGLMWEEGSHRLTPPPSKWAPES